MFSCAMECAGGVDTATEERPCPEGACPANLHRDPFDRILVAQAISEGMTLVTADGLLARYPGPILKA